VSQLSAATAAKVVAGDRAVSLLQRKCACGASASDLTGECEECQRRQVLGLQPKLASGAAGDPTAPMARRYPSRSHSSWRQRATSHAADGAEGIPAAVTGVLGSSGRPLDPSARHLFEARFGHDFGDVRIHADAAAAASARALRAHAYTSGRDIVFAAGRYDASSASGQRLLAHELTHVVQQRSGLAAVGFRVADAPAEREADRNAERLHTRDTLHVVERAPALARKRADETTTTVTAPTGPPGCTLEQHKDIEPAVGGAQRRLRRVVERVDAYVRAPADAANQTVRAALDRHFHSTDVGVASRVRDRLETIRTDMTSRDPFTVECHDDTDTSCTNAGAYVRGSDMLVLCPPFFKNSANWRIGALIHEMAHALTGLDITDRAYVTDRLLPYLSTAEALDNAESYEMFAREVDSGRAARGSAPRDVIEDCSRRTQPLVQEAIARAQRWNSDAGVIAKDQSPDMVTSAAPMFTRHLGDATPATRTAARRVFSDMVSRLKSPIDVQCDNEAAPECSSTRRAYKGSKRNIREGVKTGAIIGGGLGAGAGIGAAIGAAVSGVGALASFGLFGAIALGGLALGVLVGLIVGAAMRRPEVHVCPNWASLPSVEDRTESLLAAIYESYADLDVRRSRQYAALARELHTTFWPAPPPV
jgi:hypothetical protein